jgi:hypothetical protein
MTDKRKLILSRENYIQKRDLEWMERIRSSSNEEKIIIPSLIKEKSKYKIELGKGKYGYFRINVPAHCNGLKFFVNSWKGTCVFYLGRDEIPNENKCDWSFSANNFNLLFKKIPSILYLTILSIADFRGDISYEFQQSPKNSFFEQKLDVLKQDHEPQKSKLDASSYSYFKRTIENGEKGEKNKGNKKFKRNNGYWEAWKKEVNEKRMEEEKRRGRVEFWREIMGIRQYFAKKIYFMKKETRKQEVFINIFFFLFKRNYFSGG